MVATIGGNARIENVVMRAFDHIDGVDLYIAQMFYGGAGGGGTGAKGFALR